MIDQIVLKFAMLVSAGAVFSFIILRLADRWKNRQYWKERKDSTTGRP